LQLQVEFGSDLPLLQPPSHTQFRLDEGVRMPIVVLKEISPQCIEGDDQPQIQKFI